MKKLIQAILRLATALEEFNRHISNASTGHLGGGIHVYHHHTHTQGWPYPQPQYQQPGYPQIIWSGSFGGSCGGS